MKRYLDLFIDCINSIMLFLFFTALYWTFIFLFGQPMKIEYCLIILSLQLICYVINTFIHNILIYAGLHILIFIVLYNLSLGLHASAIFTIILILLCVIDLNYWRRCLLTRALPLPLVAVTIFFITSLHGTVRHSYSLLQFSYFAGILFLTLYLLRLYLMNLVRFNNTNSGHAPIAQIFTLNTKFVVGILLLLLLLTILFQSEGIEQLISQVFATIGLILKRAIAFLLSLVPNTASLDYELPPLELNQPSIPLPKPQESLLNKIFYLLGVLYEYIIRVVIIAFFMYVIIKFIVQHFHSTHTHMGDVIGADITETKAKITCKKKVARKTRFANRSVVEKVRFLYKKRIIKIYSKGYNLQISHTPIERYNDIKQRYDTDLFDLTNIYNIARYADSTLSEEELTHIKDFNK